MRSSKLILLAQLAVNNFLFTTATRHYHQFFHSQSSEKDVTITLPCPTPSSLSSSPVAGVIEPPTNVEPEHIRPWALTSAEPYTASPMVSTSPVALPPNSDESMAAVLPESTSGVGTTLSSSAVPSPSSSLAQYSITLTTLPVASDVTPSNTTYTTSLTPIATSFAGVNSTADLIDLNTWWHSTGEINTKTPVQDGNVRQSHLYSVQVATNTSQFYNSFVYETIPRNGNGKICFPGNLSSFCDIEDQISIEPDVNITMAWTQFLYGADTIVKVSRLESALDASDVVIRPTNLNYTVTSFNGSVLLSVPYNLNGVRFSVEFQDDLWTYRNSGPDDSWYVQNVNATGNGYVPEYTDEMPIVGIEPRNALLIFASPFPSQDLIPSDESNTLHVATGLVTGLKTTEQSIVYFAPGVYYLTGKAHAILSSTVSWVYLAPGAYVKGAVEYTSAAQNLKATGFGVLSGEQYVYQANAAEGYQNLKNDTTSVKMWRSISVSSNVTWTLHGLTINAQPFNSMDFYGDVDTFTVYASDYKQVGAFFGQTDGLEMYPNSHVHDIFYHSGDDVIKTYYSNVLAEGITVWKTNNAPVLQFGWYPRNLTGITVSNVNLIHSRYLTSSVPYPRALIGSAANYLDPNSTSTALTTTNICNFTISDWRSEGISPALLGVNPLGNIDTFTISKVWIEEMAPPTTGVSMSSLRVFTDAENDNISVQLGASSPGNVGMTIIDYYVGDTKISETAGNWDTTSLGALNLDTEYEGRWSII